MKEENKMKVVVYLPNSALEIFKIDDGKKVELMEKLVELEGKNC